MTFCENFAVTSQTSCLIPSISATRFAFLTTVSAAWVSTILPVIPITSYPFCCNNKAVTELSTPPLIATAAIFLFSISVN